MNSADEKTPPVLLTMFNRPVHAARVLEAIARAKPKQLFLAVDGPRPDVATDLAGVEGCRALVSRIDWDCEVHTRFREENLGCREGMIDAVSWFFDHVESGIVLEDDCLPHQELFRFCAGGLAAYRDSPQVFQISGFAHVDRFLSGSYFIPLSNSWGWATWSDRWVNFLTQHKDVAHKILATTETRLAFDLDGAYPYSKMLESSVADTISSWAVFFQSFLFWNKGIVLYPPQSLIMNIGFDGSGTHCNECDGFENTKFVKSRRCWTLPGAVGTSCRMFGKVKMGIRKMQGKRRCAPRVRR